MSTGSPGGECHVPWSQPGPEPPEPPPCRHRRARTRYQPRPRQPPWVQPGRSGPDHRRAARTGSPEVSPARDGAPVSARGRILRGSDLVFPLLKPRSTERCECGEGSVPVGMQTQQPVQRADHDRSNDRGMVAGDEVQLPASRVSGVMDADQHLEPAGAQEPHLRQVDDRARALVERAEGVLSKPHAGEDVQLAADLHQRNPGAR